MEIANVEIRIARSGQDFARFRALLVEYEADLPAELRYETIPDSWYIVPGDREAVFLAVRDDEVIGCVAACRFDDETAVVMRLYVQPQARGSGTARALVNAALEFMRASGYKRAVLDTAKERMQPAYGLYRSLGFSDCEPYGSVDYLCPTFMELLL